MSAPAPIVTYIAEIPKDDVCRSLAGFSLYSPSPTSPGAVQEALAAGDKDLAAIQLAHDWLKTDHWIHQHNVKVEEAEKAQKEAEDMRKVEEKKKAEIEEDRRRRAELAEKKQKELEWRRKEKGKGRAREDMLEAGLSRPRKRRAESEEGGPSSKRPKVSSGGIIVLTDGIVQFNPEEHQSKPLRDPSCWSCLQHDWACINQSGEKTKVKSCLACNVKKVPC